MESNELYAYVQRTMQLATELNCGYKSEGEVREYLNKITGKETDKTTRIFPIFNINYGKGLSLSKG